MSTLRLSSVRIIIGLVAALLLAGVAALSIRSVSASHVDLSKLDHFKCYSITSSEGELSDPGVGLVDQFDSALGVVEEKLVERAEYFCNPVEKTVGRGKDAKVTPIVDPAHHLKAYRIVSPEPVEEPEWIVKVQNQFGNDQKLLLGPAFALLVPTQKLAVKMADDTEWKKTKLDFPGDLDHYKCYPVTEGGAINQDVRLRDQFHGKPQATVLRPLAFCNPVTKQHGGRVYEPDHPELHLVAYEITPNPFTADVKARNQFGEELLVVGAANVLLVPSEKVAFTPVLPPTPTPAPTPTPTPTPTPAPDDADGDGIPEAEDNCPDVFNPEQIDNDVDGIGNACDDTPNGEEPTPTPTPPPTGFDLDHFLCYYISGGYLPIPEPAVFLEDQFIRLNTSVNQTTYTFCNPVSKQMPGEQPTVITDPRGHLVMYLLTTRPSFGTAVQVTNQFGTQSLSVGNPNVLAVPTEKIAVDGGRLDLGPSEKLNHFTCYPAIDMNGYDIGLDAYFTDQFGDHQALVLRANALCNPAGKIHGSSSVEVTNPIDHLVCYILDLVSPVERRVTVVNQFASGDLQTLRPASLCVPSHKIHQ